jgi:hypothetical protein
MLTHHPFCQLGTRENRGPVIGWQRFPCSGNAFP